ETLGDSLDLDVEAAAARSAAPVPGAGTTPPPAHGKVLASPATRHLAREHGIDLAAVRGSGKRGRIERSDVQALVEERATRRRSARSEDEPAPRHRVALARRLERSVQTIPQISLVATADMTRARAR